MAVRISAVVPCYNGSAFLAEALESIAAQTRQADEVIVVDDGSTDGSADLAGELGATVLRHPANRGEGTARNTGWRAASGDAVAWLDADDTWRPHHLEVVGGLLERHLDAAGAFGAVQCFGLNDQTIFGHVPTDEPGVVVHEAFHNWLHVNIAAITRRDALASVGGYDERERISVDFDLWLRLARHHRFIATHEVTADWRWHEAQQSAKPFAQLLAVHRYRRRFIASLRADGDEVLAAQLASELVPAWTAHLAIGRDQVRRRAGRREHIGPRQHPPGVEAVDRLRWAVASRLHPSVIDVVWRLGHRIGLASAGSSADGQARVVRGSR